MREVIKTLVSLLVVCTLTLLVIRYVGQRTVVDGSSMEPVLMDGDNLIVDKLTYRLKEPERFDIIVFPYGEEEDTYFIKRIIGLPGELVQIDGNGTIFIDGEKLTESYGKEVIESPGIASGAIRLGEDEYFVLGDNRNDSMDSRDGRVGLVKGPDIMGRAWLRVYPWERFGSVVPDAAEEKR